MKALMQIGDITMPSITVRNVPDDVHQGLRMLAAKHGRSAEAEIRAILAKAIFPDDRIKLGSLLSEISQSVNLSDEEVESFAQLRDKTPAEPLDFG